MSLSEMQKQKISTDLSLVPSSSQAPGTSSSSTVPSSSPLIPQVESAMKPEPQPVKRAPGGAKAVVVNSVNSRDQNSSAEVKKQPEESTVKLSELNVPLSSIRPSPSIPPLTLPIESGAETGKLKSDSYALNILNDITEVPILFEVTQEIQLNSEIINFNVIVLQDSQWPYISERITPRQT